MKKNLFLFLIIIQFVHSQEGKKMSYYFNMVSVSTFNNHIIGLRGKSIRFFNTQDTTYSMTVSISNSGRRANLIDLKNKNSIRFDADFDYEKIEDLSKLTNATLFSNISIHRHRKSKKYTEECEFEKDATQPDKTLVHLIGFKNAKKKKIIEEHYYYFGNRDNIIDSTYSKKSIKEYLNEKYNVNLTENQNLYKILHLEKGEIAAETEFIEVKKVDYNFEFTIDHLFFK